MTRMNTNTGLQLLHKRTPTYHNAGGLKTILVNITTRRHIHFLPILGLWGAKHVSTWTLYNACKAYGWPRVYRRLLEQNRAVNTNLEAKKRLQYVVRLAIEAPPQFAAKLSEYAKVLMPFLQKLAEQAEPNVPRFLVVAAKYVVNSQKPMKIIQDFTGAAQKRA